MMKSFKDYLVETFQTNSVTSHHDGERFNQDLSNWKDSPTSGSYGYVELDDNNPHTVVKKPHSPFKKATTPAGEPDWDDAYYGYIKYVVDNKLAQENPYFPRVFKLETKVDQYEKILYDIELEKLFNFKELTNQESKLIGEKIFGEIYTEQTKTYAFINATKHGLDSYRSLLLSLVADAINYNQTYAEDELFTSAVKILNQLHKKYKYWTFDLHQGNFMFRRSKFGIQIVIVDPFS